MSGDQASTKLSKFGKKLGGLAETLYYHPSGKPKKKDETNTLTAPPAAADASTSYFTLTLPEAPATSPASTSTTPLQISAPAPQQPQSPLNFAGLTLSTTPAQPTPPAAQLTQTLTFTPTPTLSPPSFPANAPKVTQAPPPLDFQFVAQPTTQKNLKPEELKTLANGLLKQLAKVVYPFENSPSLELLWHEAANPNLSALATQLNAITLAQKNYPFFDASLRVTKALFSQVLLVSDSYTEKSGEINYAFLI